MFYPTLHESTTIHPMSAYNPPYSSRPVNGVPVHTLPTPLPPSPYISLSLRILKPYPSLKTHTRRLNEPIRLIRNAAGTENALHIPLDFGKFHDN